MAAAAVQRQHRQLEAQRKWVRKQEELSWRPRMWQQLEAVQLPDPAATSGWLPGASALTRPGALERALPLRSPLQRVPQRGLLAMRPCYGGGVWGWGGGETRWGGGSCWQAAGWGDGGPNPRGPPQGGGSSWQAAAASAAAAGVRAWGLNLGMGWGECGMKIE